MPVLTVASVTETDSTTSFGLEVARQIASRGDAANITGKNQVYYIDLDPAGTNLWEVLECESPELRSALNNHGQFLENPNRYCEQMETTGPGMHIPLRLLLSDTEPEMPHTILNKEDVLFRTLSQYKDSWVIIDVGRVIAADRKFEEYADISFWVWDCDNARTFPRWQRYKTEAGGGFHSKRRLVLVGEKEATEEAYSRSVGVVCCGSLPSIHARSFPNAVAAAISKSDPICADLFKQVKPEKKKPEKKIKTKSKTKSKTKGAEDLSFLEPTLPSDKKSVADQAMQLIKKVTNSQKTKKTHVPKTNPKDLESNIFVQPVVEDLLEPDEDTSDVENMEDGVSFEDTSTLGEPIEDDMGMPPIEENSADIPTPEEESGKRKTKKAKKPKKEKSGKRPSIKEKLKFKQ